jgi:hypothetical protein
MKRRPGKLSHRYRQRLLAEGRLLAGAPSVERHKEAINEQ